jgi:hypothetical protein
MKTKSAKAKGRRLQNWVACIIGKITGYKVGKDEMIAPREMGQNGVDVRLVGDVRKEFPFSIECKNQESWSIHDWIKQAKGNVLPDTDWMIIASRNNTPPVLIMDAETFFEYWNEYLAYCSEKFELPAKKEM